MRRSDRRVVGDDDTAPADELSPTVEEAEPEAETLEPEAETLEPEAETLEPEETPSSRRRIDWSRVLAHGLLPAVALVLALGAGVLKYVDNSVRDDERAGNEALAAARATTAAMLSYTPDNVDQRLRDVQKQLTGDFRNQYGQTAEKVVIPGAVAQQVTAETKVPAASVVSVEPHRVVVLLFVDQTVTVAAEPPTVSSSSARVTLDEIDGKWLVSEFGTN
jgi:Mce-associated membrane protein